MRPNNKLKEYTRVMSCIDIDESVKQEIIKNCARYGTFKKIKSRKFRIISVKNAESPKQV